MNETLPKREKTLLTQELTLQGLCQMLWSGNPLYLVSAALALHASTILFDTGNIWMESGVPVAILAGYTALCAATANFVVRHGSVWDDARSLLFIVLALPVALSASLDDKLIDRPAVGAVWMAGGLLFTAAIAFRVKREIGIRFSPWLWSIGAIQLTLFFGWPFFLSQMLGDTVSRDTQIWSIVLFPCVFALSCLPLLRAVGNGDFAAENGTPWKRMAAVIFSFYLFAAMIRTYLMTISFYGGRGVGGYGRMETGFGLWMILPLVVAGLLLWIESALRDHQIKRAWKIAVGGAIVIFLLVGCNIDAAEKLFRIFFFAIWGRDISAYAPVTLAAAIPFVYLGIRRQHWGWLPAALLLGNFARLLFDNQLMDNGMMLEHLLLPVEIFVGTALLVLAVRKRNCVTLSILLIYLAMVGALLARHQLEIPDLLYMLLLAINVELLVVSWIYHRRNLEITVAALLTVLFFPAIIWSVQQHQVLFYYCFIGIFLLTLLSLRHKIWIPTAVQSAVLLIWGITLICQWLDRLPWRGSGIVFLSLLFFGVAFLVSLSKAGILQRKFQELKNVRRPPEE